MKTKSFFRWIGISVLGLYCVSVQGQAAGTTEGPDIKAVMYSFWGSLQGLKPYMVSADEFAKPENKKDILQKLSEFSKTVESSQMSRRNALTTIP